RPRWMRSRWVARARKASGFRGCRFIYVYVEAGENSLAAGLTRDAHVGCEIIRRRAGDTTLRDATVAVSIEHVAFVVHRDLIKVEQVAIIMAATLLPDAGHALNGIIGSGVNRRPRCASIVGGGDERIPFARKT